MSMIGIVLAQRPIQKPSMPMTGPLQVSQTMVKTVLMPVPFVACCLFLRLSVAAAGLIAGGLPVPGDAVWPGVR